MAGGRWPPARNYGVEVTSGNSRGEAWPRSGTRSGQRLPRIEDVPAATEGYDRESVRAAFDSFYRHIAQLDSTLRALEAVELFRDQAGELRRELRGLKAASWAQRPADGYPAAPSPAGRPEWLPRVAIEAAFLIVVAVVVAVTGFEPLSIVLVMALAWLLVGVVEWAASRARFPRKRGTVPALVRQEQAPAPLGVGSAEPAAGHAEPWTVHRIEAAVDDARTLVRPDTDERAPAPADEPARVGVQQPEPVAEQPASPAEVEPVRRDAPRAEAADRRGAALAGLGLLLPRWRSTGRRRVVLAGLLVIALPAAVAPPALFIAGEKGRPTAAHPPVVRHTPRPHAVGPDAIGRVQRETPPPRTDAVVRASRGDSWVEVRANSPDGKELYAGMLVHGRFVHTRSERVWLRLGAASNVDVRVNGKDVGPLFGTVAVLLTPRGVATS